MNVEAALPERLRKMARDAYRTGDARQAFTDSADQIEQLEDRVGLYERAALAVLRSHLACPEDAEFVLAGMLEEMRSR